MTQTLVEASNSDITEYFEIEWRQGVFFRQSDKIDFMERLRIAFAHVENASLRFELNGNGLSVHDMLYNLADMTQEQKEAAYAAAGIKSIVPLDPHLSFDGFDFVVEPE